MFLGEIGRTGSIAAGHGKGFGILFPAVCREGTRCLAPRCKGTEPGRNYVAGSVRRLTKCDRRKAAERPHGKQSWGIANSTTDHNRRRLHIGDE